MADQVFAVSDPRSTLPRTFQDLVETIQAAAMEHEALPRTFQDLVEAIEAAAMEHEALQGQYEAIRQTVVVQQRRLAAITSTLDTFYAAPVTISSLQPILDLAVQLNPRLKR